MGSVVHVDGEKNGAKLRQQDREQKIGKKSNKKTRQCRLQILRYQRLNNREGGGHILIRTFAKIIFVAVRDERVMDENNIKCRI